MQIRLALCSLWNRLTPVPVISLLAIHSGDGPEQLYFQDVLIVSGGPKQESAVRQPSNKFIKRTKTCSEGSCRSYEK